MQSGCRKRRNLIAGSLVHVAVAGQQATGHELRAQLLNIAYAGRDFDLCQSGSGIATLDKAGDLGRPEARTGHKFARWIERGRIVAQLVQTARPKPLASVL